MSDQEPNVQSGGWLKGYRTYVSVAVLLVSAVASYLVGDHSLQDTLTALIGAAGLIFAAKH
jgi:hypothetical protein